MPGAVVLYVATGDNYSHPATDTSDAIVALNLNTGRIVWSQQTTPNDVYNSACGRQGANCPPDSGPDHDYGASAMLVRTAAGREVLVAGQKSGVVYGAGSRHEGKAPVADACREGGHQRRRAVGDDDATDATSMRPSQTWFASRPLPTIRLSAMRVSTRRKVAGSRRSRSRTASVCGSRRLGRAIRRGPAAARLNPGR